MENTRVRQAARPAAGGWQVDCGSGTPIACKMIFRQQIANAMRPTLKQRQIKTQGPNTPDSAPRLPHERDESEQSQSSEPRQDMQQAYEDIQNGLVDTDLRGGLGSDDPTRARDKPDKTGPDARQVPDPNSLKGPGGK